MRIAFVVGGITSNASGLVPAMGGLARGLSSRGESVTLLTTACAGRETMDFGLDGWEVERVIAPAKWLGRLSYSPSMQSALNERAQHVDVIHNHSLWVLPNHYASEAARAHGKPVIFSPQGALEPWARSHSAWKKLLVSAWFQDRDLASAACFHATSEPEARNLRRLGIWQPIAVIPNGVDVSPIPGASSRDALDELAPAARGRRVLLFLARLHQKKGLGHLIPAWASVIKRHPDWHLVIAGPDDGYENTARGLISALGVGESISLTGKLAGSAKRAALEGAEAFVLASFSEGFSLAVLEAMAVGLPVIVSTGCNFREVQDAGAGLEIQPNVADTARGLESIMARSQTELKEMGARGQELIKRKYTWDRIARDMVDVYRWILSGGVAPGSIFTS